MSRFVHASGALLLTGALVVPSAQATSAEPADTSAEEADFTLTLLHGNDPESQLLHTSSDADFGGAARYTALLDELRGSETDGTEASEEESDHRGVVAVNAGDMYLPGPEFAASREEGASFHDALAAGYAGYDAVSMGNHEFDFGPDLYAEFIGELPEDTPVVAANVDVSGEPELAAHEEAGRIAPSTVVEIEGEQVGVVGALYPELESISSPRDVVVDEVAGPVQTEVDRLTGEGVDKIIAVSHLQDITNEEAIAAELSGVDAMVAGGGHEVMAGEDDALVPGDEVTTHPGTGEPLTYPLITQNADGADVPIVTAGSDYKYVGRLVVNFDADGNLLSISDRSGPVVVDDSVEPDPRVQEEVTEPVADHVTELAETEVARSEVALDGHQDPGVRTQETNLGNLMADSLMDTGRRNADEYGVPEPQIGIQNGGGIRNSSLLPVGPVTALDTYSIAAFANQVTVVPEVPRAQIKELLEHGVSALPHADGAFMQVGGVNFAYDPEGTAQEVDADGEILTEGSRVRNAILHDGTVIVEDGETVEGDPITIATNDFSASGGDSYPFRGADFTVVGSTYQAALEQQLTQTLEGVVSESDYPEGGSDRIVEGERATEPEDGGEGTPTDPPSTPPAEEPTEPGGPGDDGPASGDGPEEEDKGDSGALPVTGGALTVLLLAAAMAVGAGGTALYLGRRRPSAAGEDLTA